MCPGSSEGHTAYLYRCTHVKPAASAAEVCDPLFRECIEVMSVGGVGAWARAKEAEDERMSGASRRPRTRALSKIAAK